MTLLVDKRYEIIFLSHHPMGPQLGVKAVAKEIKCAKSTVQYWLNRWKEFKGLSDSKSIGRSRSTTKKVDQRISDLASTNNSATASGIQRVVNRNNVDISHQTIERIWGQVYSANIKTTFNRKTSLTEPMLQVIWIGIE